jgi:hypothetical protein
MKVSAMKDMVANACLPTKSFIRTHAAWSEEKTVMAKLLETFYVQILQTTLGYWQIMENSRYHRRAT